MITVSCFQVMKTPLNFSLAKTSGFQRNNGKNMSHLKRSAVNHKDYNLDAKAADLYQSDRPNLCPVTIHGDGNCLPRCASLLASATQELHVEMRVRIVSELCSNEDFYLNNDSLRGDASHLELVSLTVEYRNASPCFLHDEMLTAENSSIDAKQRLP